MTKIKSNLKSNCCNAKIKVEGDEDFKGITCTMYYVCTKCKKDCDFHLDDRKTWKINPVTKVKGDNRGKIKEKLIKKEIKEIL